MDKNIPKTVSGVAYGSYARSLLISILDQLEMISQFQLIAESDLFWHAVKIASNLVSQIKS
jgi:hypothetical protein